MENNFLAKRDYLFPCWDPLFINYEVKSIFFVRSQGILLIRLWNYLKAFSGIMKAFGSFAFLMFVNFSNLFFYQQN